MNETQNQPPIPRKRRWLRTLLHVILVFFVVYAAYRYTLYRMVEAKLDAIRKEGYPVTLEELDKWYKQPPPGENAADGIKQTTAALKSWPTNNLVPLPEADGSKLPNRREPILAELKTLIGEYLAANQLTIDGLHRAVSLKSCRYPINLEEGLAVRLPHLKQQLMPNLRLLELSAILAAENDSTERAAKSLGDGLLLAQTLSEEPVPTSQLARTWFEEFCMRTLERVSTRVQISEVDLLHLQTILETAEQKETSGWTRAFVGELCRESEAYSLSGKQLGHLLMESAEFKALHGSPPNPKLALLGFSIILRGYRFAGLLDLDHLRYLRTQQDYLRCLQWPPPKRLEIAKSVAATVESFPSPSRLAGFFLIAREIEVQKDCTHLARLRAARTSNAIERYRLANRSLPAQLEQLIPRFLESVPLDPFSKESLRYRRLGEGYVIYSIGTDGVDDGGSGYRWEHSKYVQGSDITFTVER